jgi:subtilisin family serine protease
MRLRSPFSMLLAVACLAAAAAAPADAGQRYLVVLAQNAVAPGAAAALVESRSATVVREHADLGVVLAESDDPGFAARMGRAAGVARDDLRPTAWGFDTYLFGTLPEEDGLTEVSPLVDWTDHTYDPTFVPPEILPTRFFYPSQWDMVKMGMDRAWAEGYSGDPDTIIAVVASGIDYTHEELRGRVDFDLSRNFVPEDAAMVEALYPGAHPIADLGLHGTYVASMMVCNAYGMACSVPNARLVGVKWLNNDEEGRIGDLVSAIDYASSIDSDVIVIPDYIGRMRMSNPEHRPLIIALRRAVNRAQAHGSIVLAGAWTERNDCGINADGNGDELIMPAEAGTTVVGATGTEDQWSAETSYGFSLIDIAAPGGQRDPVTCETPATVNIFSIGACSGFTHYVSPRPFDFSTVCNFETTPVWLFSFGARPAVAHTASVAALIEERNGERNGQWVLHEIFRTADDVLTPGTDPYSGHGRVNAYRAVTE